MRYFHDEYLGQFVRLVNLRLIDATKKDIHSRDEDRRLLGWMFLFSQSFDETCLWCGLDPDYTRRVIINRSQQ